ncbi:UNVERIFIED_CONTAM: hypothetical protein Sradi_4114000 [Sesamum radiatum]|uniref:Ty3-gypsy retrotransposon protein n=1 Tax=Sesamum radiatum TaxID=300843 RepID=A0AAW2P277_SESRA
MTFKKDKVAMNENNGVNTNGQSSTGGKIVDITPLDGLNSTSPTEINSKSTFFTILSAMMIDTTAMKEQLTQMAQAIAILQKIVKDKDLQIAQLTSNQEHTNVEEPNDNHKHVPFSNYIVNEKQVDKTPATHDSVPKFTHFETSIASLFVQQLQEIITNAIQIHFDRTTQSSPTYSKPYTKHVDALRIPIGYQPPELRQFDGKCNPKQYIAHFIKTCNNAATDGNILVKQLVQSLKGNAFDWYVDLEFELIDEWDEMEKKFLSYFYSTSNGEHG